MTLTLHTKGERRIVLDRERWIDGEPPRNAEKNSTPYSRFPKGSKASRKRGRNRFKTGKKQH